MSPYLCNAIYQYWGDLVKNRTNGRINTVVYPGASLMALTEHFIAMSQGSLDAGLLLSSMLDPSVPELTVLTLGGSYNPDPPNIIKINRMIAPVMREILKKHNIMYLFATYEGETVFTIRKGIGKPVTKLADLKGLKIRDFGKWSGELIKRWGASPVTIPIGEVPLALQKGAIDGGYFNWLTAKAIKAAEEAPFMTYMGLSGVWVFTGINLNLFNGLSSDDQKILLQAADESTNYSAQTGEKAKKDFFDNPGGFKISYLSKEEQLKAVEIANSLIAEVKKTLPPMGIKLAEVLEKTK